MYRYSRYVYICIHVYVHFSKDRQHDHTHFTASDDGFPKETIGFVGTMYPVRAFFFYIIFSAGAIPGGGGGGCRGFGTFGTMCTVPSLTLFIGRTFIGEAAEEILLQHLQDIHRCMHRYMLEHCDLSTESKAITITLPVHVPDSRTRTVPTAPLSPN